MLNFRTHKQEHARLGNFPQTVAAVCVLMGSEPTRQNSSIDYRNSDINASMGLKRKVSTE